MIYDANVFYPAPLRDLLMELAGASLFRARWTNRIHDEWIRNLMKNRPDIPPEKLERIRFLINRHAFGCLVEGYDDLINALTLPDPNDRHVLAAAIKCNADAIVTFNLKDFPKAVLQAYEIQAIHPDDFILDLFDLNTSKVIQAVRTQRSRLKHPPKSATELIEILGRQGLSNTVHKLKAFETMI